ncbi:MAG: hypothetical protein IKQ68_07905 [Prevotella sp.]|nr:hypothetical protein [Prevotella sp.]
MEKKRVFLWDALSNNVDLTAKQPGIYLPFVGDLPLIKNPGQENLFRMGCEGKTYLDECDNWIQQILIKAQRISAIDNGFRDFLIQKGILEKYVKMSSDEKVAEMQRFFDSTIIDKEDLIIKNSVYGKL